MSDGAKVAVWFSAHLFAFVTVRHFPMSLVVGCVLFLAVCKLWENPS